jgi:beta-mannosidase
MRWMLLFLIFPTLSHAQTQFVQSIWQFRAWGTERWFPAQVPGTVHTDLMALGKIRDPFFGEHEKELAWVADLDWEYQTSLRVPSISPSGTQTKKSTRNTVSLVFDGIDTYASIYWKGKELLRTHNMFRRWQIELPAGDTGTLSIRLHSAKRITDSIAASMKPLVIPDHPRVYARKAPYHFGWDWGPTLVTSGIWKSVYWQWNPVPAKPSQDPGIQLIQKKDAVGESFYFQKGGQKIYMKGANWIPADVFLPRLKRADYERLLQAAKDAGVNMLRVWGGGIYESDDFYQLCDAYGIYVWQDFMFAGGMIPTDTAFFNNVKQEVIEQIERLRSYRCIVLWCGNNEIDEAWHNWGWKQSFQKDSLAGKALWQTYTKLFRDSIPKWVQQYDGKRAYISSSPQLGWGRKESITQGDSHYWGLWWGLEPVSVFSKKTGRFVSEYGMQAMPDLHTSQAWIPADQQWLFSPALRQHQKHPTGFQTLQHYLHMYLVDSATLSVCTLEAYTYLTQCLQHYILEQSIGYHMRSPHNAGTLVWQWNDCWPVCSWSMTDYARRPKAGWYAIKKAYMAEQAPPLDSTKPRDWVCKPAVFKVREGKANELVIEAQSTLYYLYGYGKEGYLYLPDNYFHVKAGETKTLTVTPDVIQAFRAGNLKWMTYNQFR